MQPGNSESAVAHESASDQQMTTGSMVQRRWIAPHGSVLPPPPPGVRHVSLVRIGVVIADDDLRRRVDRFFHTPMIILALLVLPLLLIDVLYIREGDQLTGEVPTQGWLWWVFIIGMTAIWLAFAAEFVVKIAIAESRLEYLRRNWLDLIIIVIPLLRPLRVASVARSTKLFRLRGVGFKLARYLFTAIIGLEATNRMMQRLGLRMPARCKEPEQMTRHELEREVKRLRRLAEDWQRWHAAQQQFLAQQRLQCPSVPAPHQQLEHGQTLSPDADARTSAHITSDRSLGPDPSAA